MKANESQWDENRRGTCDEEGNVDNKSQIIIDGAPCELYIANFHKEKQTTTQIPNP